MIFSDLSVVCVELCCHGLHLFTFLSSYLEPLGQFQQNLAQSILEELKVDSSLFKRRETPFSTEKKYKYVPKHQKTSIATAYLIELGMMNQICSNEGQCDCSGVGNIEIAKISQNQIIESEESRITEPRRGGNCESTIDFFFIQYAGMNMSLYIVKKVLR